MSLDCWTLIISKGRVDGILSRDVKEGGGGGGTTKFIHKITKCYYPNNQNIMQIKIPISPTTACKLIKIAMVDASSFYMYNKQLIFRTDQTEQTEWF